MSASIQNYWNPEDDSGRSFNDQLIYDDAYYKWTKNKKYISDEHLDQVQYPRMRNEMQFFNRDRDVYKPDLSSNGAATIYKKFNETRSQDINYFRHVYPPTYYEMWG